MYRAVVLVLFIITALADKDLVKSACNKFHFDLIYCCQRKPAMPPMGPVSIFMDCYEKTKASPPENSCEMEECLAQNLGYHGTDGKLDIDGFTVYIENELKNDPDFFSVIKEKCLNTDISKYGPAHFCDFMKMKICFYLYLLEEKCSEWSDEGECKGIKDTLQECKAE